MIQSLVPSLVAPTAAPLDALLQVTTSTPEAPDFAALLAQSAVPAAASDALPPVPTAQTAAMAEAATVLIPVAVTGNPVPPPMPDLAAPLPLPASLPLGSLASAAEQSDPVAEAAETLLPQLQAATATRPLRAARQAQVAPRPQAARAATKTATPPPESEAIDPAPLPQPGEPDAVAKISVTKPEPQSLPQQQSDQTATAAPPNILAQVAAALPAPVAVSASQPQAVQSEPSIPIAPRARPAVLATPDPAPQAVAHAAPQAAFLRTAAAPITAQPDQPVTPPDAPQQAVRPPAMLRVEIAAAGAAEPIAKALDMAWPAPRRTVLAEAVSAASVLGTPDSAAPQPAAALTTPTLAASPRPHDFAALVDRLVAAREAVQPQGATLTVAHAEFGPVELRFRHEPHGLAVSLASADPDFSRAAAAAPPINLPVSTATFVAAEPGPSAPSRDTAASPGGSANGQSRGQQSERRDGSAQQSHHGPRGATARDAARRSGIFA